jgi:hypothetical protein
MRSFSSFLIRRKITEDKISSWFQAMGIKTPESLENFCKKESMSIDVSHFLSFFPKQESQPKDRDSGKSNKVKNSAIPKWHTPAADRPLKATAKKTDTKKKNAPSKPRRAAKKRSVPSE